MPVGQIAEAVQLLDLMLEHFADDGHWTRGRYDEGNGGLGFRAPTAMIMPAAPSTRAPRLRPSALSRGLGLPFNADDRGSTGSQVRPFR
jgi:hypothetical protein